MNDTDGNSSSPESILPENVFQDSAGFHILRIVCYIFTVLAAIPGNLLCLLVLPKTRSIPENNRLFLVSLSLADLVVGILCLLAIVPAVLNRWPFGDFFCGFSLALLGACSGVSRNSLVGISIDRYLAITKPLHYPMIVTRRKILIILSVIWVFGFFVLFLPYIGPPIVYRQNVAFCIPVWTDVDYRSQALISFTVAFLIPCPIMFFIYTRLFQITRQQLKSLLDIQTFSHQNTAENILAKESLRKKGEAKAIRMFCAVTFTFVIAWLPYLTLTLFNNFSGKETAAILEFIAVIFAMSSSWWDVVTLFGMNAGFRRTAKREIGQLCGCSEMVAQVEPSVNFYSTSAAAGADSHHH